MSSAPMLIAGGGLGGLTAALALARAGIRCHVLEKADDFVELGAGLQLAPNATRVFADLGILDRVAEVAVFPRRLVLRDAVGGGSLTELDVGELFRCHFGHPYLVMHRHDLLSILLDACRGALRPDALLDRTQLPPRPVPGPAGRAVQPGRRLQERVLPARLRRLG